MAKISTFPVEYIVFLCNLRPLRFLILFFKLALVKYLFFNTILPQLKVFGQKDSNLQILCQTRINKNKRYWC